MRVLGIVGYSGNGKTQLMTRLIPALIARGVTVSTIKHTHHSVRVDEPHDISRRLTDAGAVDVAIAGHERWALLHENERDDEPLVEDLVAHMAPVDLVLEANGGDLSDDVAILCLSRARTRRAAPDGDGRG